MGIIHTLDIKLTSGRGYKRLLHCFLAKIENLLETMTLKLSETLSRNDFHVFGMVSRKNFWISFVN